MKTFCGDYEQYQNWDDEEDYVQPHNFQQPPRNQVPFVNQRQRGIHGQPPIHIHHRGQPNYQPNYQPHHRAMPYPNYQTPTQSVMSHFRPAIPNQSSFNSYGNDSWNETPNLNPSEPWLENQNFQNQPNHDPWGENHEPYPEDSWSEYPNDSSFNPYHENPWPDNFDNSSSNLYERDHWYTAPNQYSDDSWSENFITAPS